MKNYRTLVFILQIEQLKWKLNRLWSILLHLKSVPFSKRFVPLPKRFVSFLKCFVSSQKCFVSFTKRSVQTVQIASCKAFHQKRLEVFSSFHCHHQNGNWQWSPKFTQFIWRIILLFHTSGLFLWDCFDLQVNFEFELCLQDKSTGVQLHDRI